jgi:hypothetical protein
MKLWFLILFLSISAIAYGASSKLHTTRSKKIRNTIKVAVVDTGLDLNNSYLKDRLCPSGHKDFTGKGLNDTNGHGTAMTYLIEKYAGDSDYCLLIYNYYTEIYTHNVYNETAAFLEAIKNGATIINFSSSGNEFSTKEAEIIKNNKNVTFVVAAGNDGVDLSDPMTVRYPGGLFLPNEVVVENVDQDGFRVLSSNWSSNANLMVREMGNRVDTVGLNNKPIKETGTSPATAIRTGKMIRNLITGAPYDL